MATEQEVTPLGQNVDKAVWDFAITVREHTDVDAIGHKKWNHCDVCLIARHRMENAIRARINEPRPEDPSVVSVKRFAIEHLRNYVVLLASKRVNRADAAASLEAFIEGALRDPNRTSEHSAVRAIMDTSPDNLLKLERMSNTVYVLLGHRDPDKLAAWINRAHRIANEAAQL